MYRSMVRELLRAETENEPQLVLAPSAVRFSTYNDGTVYLLNTDVSLPSAAVLLPESEEPATLVLKPLELLKVRVANGKAEIISSI